MQQHFQNIGFNESKTPLMSRDMSVAILNSLMVPPQPQQLESSPIAMPVAQSSPVYPPKTENASPISEKVSLLLVVFDANNYNI